VAILLTGCMNIIIADSAYGQLLDTFTRGESFSSPFGKRKKVTLPDQTTVMLNSNTTLWLDKQFDRQNRSVRIAGDALFNIKKNSKLFIIHTPHMIVTTTGAIAKVNAYPEVAGEETLLLKGKLKVIKNYYSTLDHEPYFLKEGDMVMMNKDIDLAEKETFDTKELDVWREDRFVVKNISLNDLVNKLKNWFNVEIQVNGEVPGNLRYSGVFDHASLQDILGGVGKVWNFRYQAHQNIILLKF
jgi:transmembrane sensor